MGTIRTRLIVLVLGLVAVTQAATIVAALARTGSAAHERAAEELTRAGAVVRERMADRTADLMDAAVRLAEMPTLRDALRFADATAADGVVRQEARRAGADRALVIDAGGRVLAASGAYSALPGPVVASIVRRGDLGRRMLVPLDGVIHQVVSVPIRDVGIPAWVIAGARVDSRLAIELRNVLEVDVAFVSSDAAGATLLGSSLTTEAMQPIAPDLRTVIASHGPRAIGGRDDGYLVVADRVEAAGSRLTVLLMKPLAFIDAAQASTQRILIALGALFSLVALSFAGVFGRTLVMPLERLVEGLRRLERGEYDTKLPQPGAAEIARLSEAFAGAQSAIAEREAKILHQAHYDALTGLPNRQRFERLIAEDAASSGDGAIAVAIIEIGNLRTFSGSLGFEFADQVLAEIARRLNLEVRDGRILSRIEGGRFALAIRDLRRSRAEALVNEICLSLRSGVRVAAINVQLELAAGIAAGSVREDLPAELLRRAEIALDAARERRIGVAVFEPEQDHLQRRRLQLSADLPDAIESGELRLVYQPKVTMAQRRVQSVEVLARWRHAVLGEVSPAEFVPVAEHIGASGTLTRWVLRTALRQTVEWHRTGRAVDVAVNLSAADVVDPTLPDFVLERLAEHGVPATSLLLEITESAFMRDVEAAERHMDVLRHAGVRFAIDDFGTGYSSLSQLKRLPVDELKIDQSFVRDATGDEDDAAIVRSTIELGHSLGLRVVAEGVETDEQWRFLDRLGCDFAQGFLIARPMTAEQFAAYLDTVNVRLESADSETQMVRALKHTG
jgi:diguanylate cyclase (GGDEF)-like protein